MLKLLMHQYPKCEVRLSLAQRHARNTNEFKIKRYSLLEESVPSIQHFFLYFGFFLSERAEDTSHHLFILQFEKQDSGGTTMRPGSGLMVAEEEVEEEEQVVVVDNIDGLREA